MQTYNIGSTAVDLPDYLETRIEDDTLIAFPPSTDFVNLRFTVISVRKGGKEVVGAGAEGLRKRSVEANAELHEEEDRVWYHTTQSASEGSPGSLMHFWYVGMGGHTLVVSCFVDAAQSGNPLAQHVLASVEPTIQSFRRNRT